MSEMVERVATAIWSANGWHPPNHEDKKTLPWALCVRQARAAFDAMREPTSNMLEAAMVEADKHGYYHTRGYIDTDDADYIFKAMLDEALK